MGRLFRLVSLVVSIGFLSGCNADASSSNASNFAPGSTLLTPTSQSTSEQSQEELTKLQGCSGCHTKGKLST